MKYSKEEKTMWLEDWKQSGKSANAYAKENGLVPWTFNKWTKDEVKTNFVEIRSKIVYFVLNEPPFRLILIQ